MVLKECKSQKEILETQVRTARQECEDLRQANQECRQQLSTKNNLIDTLQDSVQTLQGALLAEKNKRLRDVKALTEDIMGLKRVLGDKNNLLDVKKKEIKRKDDEVSFLKGQVDSKNSDIDSKDSEIILLKKQIFEIACVKEKQSDTKKSDIDRLTTDREVDRLKEPPVSRIKPATSEISCLEAGDKSELSENTQLEHRPESKVIGLKESEVSRVKVDAELREAEDKNEELGKKDNQACVSEESINVSRLEKQSCSKKSEIDCFKEDDLETHLEVDKHKDAVSRINPITSEISLLEAGDEFELSKRTLLEFENKSTPLEDHLQLQGPETSCAEQEISSAKVE